MVSAQKNLIDILIEEKKLAPDMVQRLKLESLSGKTTVEELLVSRGIVSKPDFLSAKAKSLNIPYISLIGRAISQDLLKLVSEPVARRYNIMPFEFDPATRTLSVVMADPLDFQARQFLERKTATTIKPFLGDSDEIKRKIADEYSQSLASEVTEALKETATPLVKTIAAEKLSEIIREPPIAKIVSTILEFAVRGRASDIHIEPQEKRTRVRYRIDGILNEKLVLPKSVHEAVISRIKIISDMKIDERRIPQDGRFNFKLGDEEVDLRVSTLPTVHGEKIVIRLLKKTGGIPDLPNLGLTGVNLRAMEDAIQRTYGIVLVTGPTGSGKTTTLYSILSRINTIKVNIMTLEDPVEYQIPGINQVQINPGAGLTFATGLRSFLRQDPNIILVGEIRDSETAGLAIQAALTGHLVFSTLHTNDAATAIPRLFDMRVETFLLASVLHVALAQRICRKICTACRQSYDPNDTLFADMKTVLGTLFPSQSSPKLYKGKGCSECNFTGYLGRIGIYEVLRVSEKIAKLIINHASAHEIKNQAVAEGMITMKQDGYLKVLLGITSIEEILRVAEDE